MLDKCRSAWFTLQFSRDRCFLETSSHKVQLGLRSANGQVTLDWSSYPLLCPQPASWQLYPTTQGPVLCKTFPCTLVQSCPASEQMWLFSIVQKILLRPFHIRWRKQSHSSPCQLCFRIPDIFFSPRDESVLFYSLHFVNLGGEEDTCRVAHDIFLRVITWKQWSVDSRDFFSFPAICSGLVNMHGRI